MASSQLHRIQPAVLVLDGVAVTLVIVAGFLGTGSAAGLALLVIGIVLVQVTWIPVLAGRRASAASRSSVHPADPGEA
jgi:uncharacterized membrane protein